MGSIDKACISGFLCRLCSEMHRTVIHIYGDQGQRLCLVEKINGYLPITISPSDPLPKTICTSCLRRVEQHYELLMRLTKMREQRELQLKRLTQRNVTCDDISSPECTDDDDDSSNIEGSESQQQSHAEKVSSTQSDNENTSRESHTPTLDEPIASGSNSSSRNITTHSISPDGTADPLLPEILSNDIAN